ncbi:MAG: phage holin family protein [Actinomycetota bacterium]|nr:phage holin family protein [Actinomycetota bacterium]
MSKLIRLEIQLAKQELLEIARQKAIAAGMAALGAVLAIFLVPFFLLTIFEILAVWIPRWSSALIVTVLVAAACAAIFLFAKSKFEDNVKPERTLQSLRDTLTWAKRLGRRHGRKP